MVPAGGPESAGAGEGALLELAGLSSLKETIAGSAGVTAGVSGDGVGRPLILEAGEGELAAAGGVVPFEAVPEAPTEGARKPGMG